MAPTPQSVKADTTVCADLASTITQSSLPAQMVNDTQPTRSPTPSPELGLKAKDNTVRLFFAKAIHLTIAAAIGAIVMLTGNGVLRTSHPAHSNHHTENMLAAAIGSLGAVVSAIVLLVSLRFIGIDFKKDNQRNRPMLFKIIITVVLHTLSGALGSSILLSVHVDLGPIDVLHATCAGAVGGTILALVIPVSRMIERRIMI